MKRLSLALFLSTMICDVAAFAAEDEDSADGLPAKYAKDYLIASNTISPEREFAVMYPANEPKLSDSDYVVALKPFAVLTKLATDRPYFRNENHGSLKATWSGDSSAVLITLGIKWGPGDVFLVELKNGKAARTTNLLAKVRAALLPDYRKAKAGKYNDTYDFVFEEADNNGFEFGGAGHVRINVFATTDPKGVSNSVWEGRFTGAWDIGHAKFTSAKVTREFAGTREHKPED